MVFSKLCKHLASRQNFYLFFCYRWAQCNLLKENHCVKSVTAWSVFSLIQTEYGEIRSISSYSVRISGPYFPAFGLNTKRCGVSLFPHSDSIRRDTEYLFVFSPNMGKYGPEKTPYLDTFHAVKSLET